MNRSDSIQITYVSLYYNFHILLQDHICDGVVTSRHAGTGIFEFLRCVWDWCDDMVLHPCASIYYLLILVPVIRLGAYFLLGLLMLAVW
jgi:hypothetical protein